MVRAASDAPEEALWVDNYAPRSFLELLSDEAINRAVVKWLKSWDAAVFGTGQSTAAAGGAAGRGLAAGRRGQAAVERRPAQRVLLMGGPPGNDADPPEALVERCSCDVSALRRSLNYLAPGGFRCPHHTVKSGVLFVVGVNMWLRLKLDGASG